MRMPLREESRYDAASDGVALARGNIEDGHHQDQDLEALSVRLRRYSCASPIGPHRISRRSMTPMRPA